MSPVVSFGSIAAYVVLLIPLGCDNHGRHRQRLRTENAVERLILPVAIIRRVLRDLPPEGELIEPLLPREPARGPGTTHRLVVVVAIKGQVVPLALRRRLTEPVAELVQPKGSVVKPIVSPPAIDHRAHRDGGLEGGMRMDERHQHGEALVRRADHRDPAVGLGDVLREPVDRVIRVGRVIDRCVVERAT